MRAMPHSVFDLFKIGVGPSSSHTMGPMSAACAFTEQLRARGLLDHTDRVLAELYGSLALTGKGHASDRAVLLGLAGKRPDGICPDEADRIVTGIRASQRLMLGGTHEIAFDENADLLFHQRERLSFHSNGMRFTAFDADGAELSSGVWYSVGGGAILAESEVTGNAPPEGLVADVPHPFHSGEQLLERSAAAGLAPPARRSARPASSGSRRNTATPGPGCAEIAVRAGGR